jgi:putative membrane protein
MQLQKGIARWNSTQLRIWNELATLLLFAIVFLIVLKNTLHMAWGIVALIGLGLVLMLGIRVYKKIRNQ